MKLRIFFTLLFSSITAMSVSALDFGGSIGDASVYTRTADNGVTQSNKASLWFNLPLGDMNLAGDGNYTYVYTWAAPNSSTLDQRFDLGSLILSGLTPLDAGNNGVLDWRVGRLRANDITGWILGSRVDGAGTNWQKGNLQLSVGGYYSGLVLKSNSTVSISAADIKDGSDTTVILAPKRVIGSLGASLFELFSRQDLKFELVGQYDLRAAPDNLDTVYFSTLLTGPLPQGFRYQAFLTGETAILGSGSPTFSFLSGFQVSLIFPFLGSRLVWDGQYGQRIGSDDSNFFLPISGRGVATVTTLETANGAATGLDYSLRPFPKTTFGLKGDVLFRTTNQSPPNLTGFDPTTKDYFIGEEVLAYTSWEVSSEFSLGFTAGLFNPSTTAFTAGTKQTYLAVLTADLEL